MTFVKSLWNLLLCPALISSIRIHVSKPPLGLSATERPNIGILALPMDNELGGNYIQAAYASWLLGAGAAVTPIPSNLSNTDVDDLMTQLNGVLFTGGPKKPTSFPAYFGVATRIYENIINASKSGEWLPLWGTCLGLQAISDIVAGGVDILSNYSGVQKLAMPLNWAPKYKRSRLFQGIAEVKELFERPTTSNRHKYGISPDDFEKYLRPAGYRLISTNVDHKNKTFVSTIEHETMPVYAAQWHPEAAIFNHNAWIERLPEDIKASQYIANFFVTETRKNNRRPRKELPSIEDFPRRRGGVWQEYYYIISEMTQPPSTSQNTTPRITSKARRKTRRKTRRKNVTKHVEKHYVVSPAEEVSD